MHCGQFIERARLGAAQMAGVFSTILLLALSAGRPVALGGPQDGPAGAVVEGIVVSSTTGEPVPRAEVQLRLWKLPEPVARSQSLPPEPQTLVSRTDSGGKFRFEGVPPGRWEISISRQGMLPARPAAGLSPHRLAVRAGDEVRGLRYALAPQAVITGKVVDEEGDPVQGALVSAARPPWRSGEALIHPVPGAKTDDRGEYRLPGLPAGTYLVYALRFPSSGLSPDGKPWIEPPAFHPDAAARQQAHPVRVQAGQELGGVDIVLHRRPAQYISGRVLMEDGTPAPNVYVRWMDLSAGLSSSVSSAATGTRGEFRIGPVPSGRCRLTATLEQPGQANARRLATMDLEVGEEDLKNVEVRFPPPVTLRGRVRFAGPDAEPFAARASELRLMLVAAGDFPWMDLRHGSVNPDATFSLEVALPDKYELSFDGELMARHLYVDSIRTASGADVSGGLEITGGAPEPIVITLRADGARVIARRPQAQNPAEECNPYRAVLVRGRNSWSGELLNPRIETIDSSGQVEFRNLPPGNYLVLGLCGEPGERIYSREWLESIYTKAAAIRLERGETRTVTLPDVPPPEDP